MRDRTSRGRRRNDLGSGGGGGFLEGPRDQDPVDLLAVQSLALKQGPGKYMELLEIGLEELAGAHRTVRDNALDLGVDEDGRLFAVVLGSRDLAAEEDMLLRFPEGQRPHLVRHAPLADHLARHLRRLLEIIAGAGGLLLDDDFLGRAAAQQNGDLVDQVLLRVAVAIVRRQLHGEAEGTPARDDGHLVERIGARQEVGHEGMAALVIGGGALLGLGDDHGAPLHPISTLSLAFSKSIISTTFLSWRAASSAASFTRLARSAPEKPEVPRARTMRSTLGASGMRRAWTRRISSRPLTSGRATTTCRSKRPGRSRAGSRTSGRLVAAMRMTPSLVSKPSISTRSWLRVCSRSSWPPPSPAPRCRPTASISSMKMMQGACFFPCSNRSRTRLAPTPTNISTKSEPEMLKNGTPASPAMARARSVLPVPGDPIKRTPLGMRPPSLVNFFGSLRNWMISSSSSFASSIPATSAKVTLLWFSLRSFAFDLPKLIALPPPACSWRIKKMNRTQMMASGIQETRNCAHSDCESSFSKERLTPFWRILSRSWVSSGETVRKSCRFFSLLCSVFPLTVTSAISPRSTTA